MSQSNLVWFGDKFKESFIQAKAKQYDVPKEFVGNLISELDYMQYKVINREHREFIDSYIAVNSKSFHKHT